MEINHQVLVESRNGNNPRLSNLNKVRVHTNTALLLQDTASDWPGGGGTPYNGPYGEAPPERGTFFSLQVYKRVGISLVEIYSL